MGLPKSSPFFEAEGKRSRIRKKKSRYVSPVNSRFLEKLPDLDSNQD
jgi:hypothetical protein